MKKIGSGFGLQPKNGRDARMLGKFGDRHIPPPEGASHASQIGVASGFSRKAASAARLPPEGGSHQNHLQDLKPEGTKAEAPAHG
jgi:hypothetical protein